MCLLPYPYTLGMFLLPGAFYIGREFAQAEERYITNYCNRKRANMPWYAAFLWKAWTVKGVLDWFLPTLVCLAFFFGSAAYYGR